MGLKVFVDDVKLYKQNGKSVKAVFGFGSEKLSLTTQIREDGIIRVVLFKDQSGERILIAQTLISLGDKQVTLSLPGEDDLIRGMRLL